MQLSRFLPIASCAVAFNFAPALSAGHDPAVIRIEKSPSDSLATYTIEQLKRDFPQHQIDTATPWSKAGETIKFRGPFLKDLIAKHRIDGRNSVEVTAFDNFITKITNGEITAYSPVVAVERACTEADRPSGACTAGQEFKPLSLEDGGPYYIVWPLLQLPKSYGPWPQFHMGLVRRQFASG